MAAPVASGTATIAGFAHDSALASAWPSPTAALVQARLPVTSVDFDPGVQQAPVVTRAQALGPSGLDVLSTAPGARLSLRWRYQDLETILAMALGYMPATYPAPLGGGAYQHLYECSADLAAELWPPADAQPPTTQLVRRGTLAAWRQVSVWQLRSAMVQSLTLTSDGERVSGDVAFVGATLDTDGDVNTEAILITLPHTTWPLVSVRHGTLRLGPRSTTTPLDASHDVCYRTCSLTLANNLATMFGPRTGLMPDEYTRTAPPTLTLTFEIPRYQSDQWLAAWGAQTPLMGTWRFIGPPITLATYPYALGWYFPALRLTDVRPSPVQVGLASVQHTMHAEVPTQLAAGMPATTFGGPAAVEVISGASNHPLL